MALFGRNSDLSVLLKRLQAREWKTREELQELIELVRADTGVAASRVTFLLVDAEPALRALGAQLIVKDRNARSQFEILVQELSGRPTAIRKEICELLVKIDAQKSQQRMQTLVHSSRAEEREVGFDLMYVLPGLEKYIHLLKQGLRDPEEAIRQRAIRILARAPHNPTIFLILRDQASSEESVLRQVAIHALAETMNPDVVDVFFQRLPHEGPHERETIVRCLSRMARISGARIEERVVAVLGDEHPEVRSAAVRLLREMPNQRLVLRAFLVHVRGLASWLRDRCIVTIGMLGSDLIVPLTELMEDDDEDIRVGAIHMVANSNDPRVIAPVCKVFLGNSDWWVRVMAAEVLAKFPELPVMRTLVSRIHDVDLRYGVIHALGRMNMDQCLPHLIECLKDPSRGIRMTVIEAVKGSRDSLVLQSLALVAMQDPDESVREKAIVVLENHGEVACGHLQEIKISRHEERREAVTVEHEDLRELTMENEALNLH